MAAEEFRDNDDGYLGWLADHPDGYVINILRSYNASTAKLHCAGCRTINGNPASGNTWTTGDYIKVCADQLADLDRWALERVGSSIDGCGICHPAGVVGQPMYAKRTKRPLTAAVADGHFVIDGPNPDSATVQVWADDYIRFEHLPAWQMHVRDEIRSRSRRLEPEEGQVLHATFCGAKLPNADVENLVLYYIDTFPIAGRYGIRFEYGGLVPPTYQGDEYPFHYRYALASRSETLTHWKKGRLIAAFDWTDLGEFKADKQLAQVWWALRRGEAQTFLPVIAPDSPYGVRIEVRVPRHRRPQPVWGAWVKGIIDGVICAFHAHTDETVLSEVARRLANTLSGQPEDIAGYLRDESRAVFGTKSRLVSPYRSGVKWDPDDHLCVAGELLAAESESADEGWAIKGEIFELSR